jgi:hypothetical protein
MPGGVRRRALGDRRERGSCPVDADIKPAIHQLRARNIGPTLVQTPESLLYASRYAAVSDQLPVRGPRQTCREPAWASPRREGCRCAG